MNFDAALATTCSIVAAGAFVFALGTAFAVGVERVRPKTGLTAVAGLIVLGAVLIGTAVGVSH